VTGRLHLALLAALLAGAAHADEPAGGPTRRFTLAGEASGTLSPVDWGYFNNADYGNNTLREVYLSLSAEGRLGRRLSVLGEVRTENRHEPRVYALYVRARPWLERSFDVQAGMIPPVFGSFPRRRYGSGNPLVGQPLAYQYLTNVRNDAVPATADDVFRMRASGWRVSYPLGSTEWREGVPLASARRWDTGVQARLGVRHWELTAALTQGCLGSPRVEDDNGGKQVSGRAAWRPVTGLVLGASGSRGAYLADEVVRLLPPGRSYHQRAWGADVEYSRHYWLVRGEGVWTSWDSPVWTTPLRARALSGEARYKLVPGAWVAARVDHLGFSEVQGTQGRVTWDAPVWRLEAGGGFALRRNLLLKASWQNNWRDGGRIRSKGMATAQVLYWF
jgi:hypothetical protein